MLELANRDCIKQIMVMEYEILGFHVIIVEHQIGEELAIIKVAIQTSNELHWKAYYMASDRLFPNKHDLNKVVAKGTKLAKADAVKFFTYPESKYEC